MTPKNPHNNQAEMSGIQSGHVSKLEKRGSNESLPLQLRTDCARIAKKARNNKVSLKLIDRIGESLGSGEYMENDDYIKFLHILSLKDFSQLPEKGEGMFFFIDTLIGKKKGNADQQEAARDFINSQYTHIEKKLSEKQLKKAKDEVISAGIEEELKYGVESDDVATYERQTDLLNDIKEVRWARHKPKSAQEIIAVTDVVTVDVDQAVTHNAAESILDTLPKITNSTYTPEQLPEETLNLLREGKRKEYAIIEQVVPLQRRATELEEEIYELEDSNLGKSKPPVDQIRKLKKELKKTQRKIEKLETEKGVILGAPEMIEAAEAYEHWGKRELARFRARKLLSEKLGFDINKPGVKIQCGNDVREIVDVKFDNEGRDDWDPDHPNLARVIYKENGKLLDIEVGDFPDYLKFSRDIHAMDGYALIKDLNELNETIAAQTGGKELAAGDVFHSKQQTFTIQEVSPKGKITLKQPVMSGYKTELTQSIANEDYENRVQRVFTFGQFSKLLSSHSFQRDIQYEEMQQVVDNNATRLTKTINSFVKGQSVEEKVISFRVPKENETREVFYRRGPNVHRAKLSVTRDDTGQPQFKFKEVPFKPRDTEALLKAGLPMRFAGASMAKANDRDVDNSTPEGKLTDRKALGAWGLIDLINRGDIIDVPPMLGGPSSPLNASSPATLSAPSRKGHFTLSADAANKHDYLAAADGKKFDTDGEAADAAGPSDVDEAGQAPPDNPVQQQKGYKEALPYDVVTPYGNMIREEDSYMTALWKDTRFFSVGDFWTMGTTMYEYYNRRFERRQKEKYSSVGQKLPFWGSEMRRINQSSETEEMNQFKETFEPKGILEIQERARESGNKDEVKAALIVLTSKGLMRWDDVGIWKNLNRWLGTDVKIPIPNDGNPYRRISDDPNDPDYDRTGMDYLKNAIDTIWGEGGYDDWYKGNLSAFRSSAQAYAEEGKELEGLQGGHGRRLSELLKLHKAGKFVDPTRFEGLLLQAIDNGKANMQEKVYFMIQGVASVNSDGRTIMPFERMAQINSTYLPRFPILEYLCASVPRPPDGKRYRWTLTDYKAWAQLFDSDGSGEKCYPGKNVDEFLWEYVITSDENKRRINKALRNGENIDHDDYFAYLPPASVRTITDACKSIGGGGGKKFLTIEGYKNVFPGFSQIMRTLSEKGDKDKLRDAISGYIRYEGIMFNRYDKLSDNYQRLDYPEDSTSCVASDSSPKALAGQMNAVIDQVIGAYAGTPGGAELNTLYNLTKTNIDPEFLISKEGKDQQQRINAAFDKLPDIFAKVVTSDRGAKMQNIVLQASRNSQIEGMPFGVPPEVSAARKANAENANKLAA